MTRVGISGRLRLAMLRYRFEESLFLYPALIMSGGFGPFDAAPDNAQASR